MNYLKNENKKLGNKFKVMIILSITKMYRNKYLIHIMAMIVPLAIAAL